MTKDPKDRSGADWDMDHISHDRALDAISKKVDEKLAQITSKSFDEEMERHLNEIQELRRQEKEALEQSRSTKRQKRKKSRGHRDTSESESNPEPPKSSRPEKDRTEPQTKSDSPDPELSRMEAEPDREQVPQAARGHSQEGAQKKNAPAAGPQKTAGPEVAEKKKSKSKNRESVAPYIREKKRKSIYPTEEELKRRRDDGDTEPEMEAARPGIRETETKPSGRSLLHMGAEKKTFEEKASEEKVPDEKAFEEKISFDVKEPEETETEEKGSDESEPEERYSPDSAAESSAKEDFSDHGGQRSWKVEARIAREESEERRVLTEDERVAIAVDRFFDTAEEIAAEEARKEREREKAPNFWHKMLAFFSGTDRRGEAAGSRRANSDGPRRTEDEDQGEGNSDDPHPLRGKNAEERPFAEEGEIKIQASGKKEQADEKQEGFFAGLWGGIKNFLRKTFHITAELHYTRKGMENQSHLTHEKRMARYRAVWAKHLAPLSGKMILLQNGAQIKGAQFSSWIKGKKSDNAVRLSLMGAKARVYLEKAAARSAVLLDYAEHHKLRLFWGFTVVVFCAVAVAVAVGNLTAYEYLYNGRVLGIVKDQQVVYKTIDIIGGKLSESLDADIEIDKEKDITFQKVVGFGLEIDSKDDVLNQLTYMKTLKAKAYAIVADGRQIGVLQSREIAKTILKDIEERFAQEKEGIEYKNVGFAQKVKVEEIDTELGYIQNADEVTQYLLTGAVEKKIHVVQKGQTFNAIAKSYGLKPSELLASNPGLNPDKLKIDQELILTQDSPVLTVQSTEVATYTEEIPFEIQYEDNNSIYKGDKKVITPGQNGQRQVVAEIVRSNGQEVSRKEISSEILSEPMTQVVQVGTKEKPKTVATGKFSYPVRGARLSSGFGRRWGRTHQGIDLAIAKGTTITAADGGTVTFAGYQGSYGYLVIIDHGNGKETYYAHCSKLLVKKGTKVYKGQAIAKVGSTGNSTGPHVHFEVHVNGVPKNPLKYL